MIDTIKAQIEAIEKRIEFLKQDRTKWTMAWEGSTYNHGPYLRRLEIRRLKGRLRTLQKKIQKISS
jgi:hypothetical protein